MSANDVIDAYVADVMRRLPGKERHEIGLELRGLLAEMLAGRAGDAGKPADDAMVLAMLRDFGTPSDVAARYRPPGTVIIPAEQTKSFALLSIGGVALQWALTLPRVFDGELHLTAWWFSWGLGALWWPGFMAMMALAGAGVRHMGWFRPAWRPRMVDPERVHRSALAFGLAWYAIGVALVVALPWFVDRLPGVLPQVFAFDPDFLRDRAWPVLLLWGVHLGLLVAVLGRGRWTARMRRLEMALSLAWIALLGAWLAGGRLFQATPTDEGAKGALALVLLMVVFDLAWRLYRGQPRFRTPKVVG